MSDTPLGIAITIPFGFGAKALDVFEPTPEVLTYSKMKGSGESVYSLTVFCPKCSGIPMNIIIERMSGGQNG